MSILIKGMEMPKSCYDCDFAYQDQDSEHNIYWTCAVVHKLACMYERRDDCPLIEVPPHGRLIDTSEAYDKIAESAGEGSGNYVDMDVVGRGLDDTPTVIEAEGET